MTLSGRPLLDNSIDAALFVGRDDELRRIGAAITFGWNVLITGEARIGKTSLLNRVALQIRSDRWPDDRIRQVFVIPSGSSLDTATLLRQIMGELVPTALPDAASLDVRRMLALLAARLPRGSGSRVGQVVILDDVLGDVGHELFGVLRDQLWEVDVTWLVSSRDAGALTTAPADAFFDLHLRVGGLSSDDSVIMLAKRLDGRHTGAWSRQVSEAVDGNPGRVLELARQVLSRDDGSLGPITALVDRSVARDAALADAGRSATMLAAELDRLGSAAASDQSLLTALGWTRARAVQVLNDLEARGLATSEQVRGARGRPRKVYRLVPVHEFDGKVDLP